LVLSFEMNVLIHKDVGPLLEVYKVPLGHTLTLFQEPFARNSGFERKCGMLMEPP